MTTQDLAFELERFLDLSKWEKIISELPPHVQDKVEGNEAEGYPTGVGEHPVYGRFVLESGGQGPSIIYLENWPN